MDETPQSEPAPVQPPQVLLTLMPDGQVAIRHNLQDVGLLTRMLAQTITAVNQPQAPKPRIVLPGVRLNGVRG